VRTTQRFQGQLLLNPSDSARKVVVVVARHHCTHGRLESPKSALHPFLQRLFPGECEAAQILLPAATAAIVSSGSSWVVDLLVVTVSKLVLEWRERDFYQLEELTISIVHI